MIVKKSKMRNIVIREPTINIIADGIIGTKSCSMYKHQYFTEMS